MSFPKIRPATPADCARCAALSRIEELRPGTGPYIPERYFRQFSDTKLFFVAAEKGRVVGYILGEEMRGNLANLGLFAVDKKQRGKGIGTLLLAAFRKACDARGLRYIVLYAPAFNAGTLTFYKRHGFTQGKRYVQFFEDRTKKK